MVLLLSTKANHAKIVLLYALNTTGWFHSHKDNFHMKADPRLKKNQYNVLSPLIPEYL